MFFVDMTIIEQWLVDTAPCEEQVLIGNHYLLTAGAATTSTSSCWIITLTDTCLL